MTPSWAWGVGRRVDLPKSTVYRILSTLVSCGFVSQNTENGKYSLGIEIIPLANSVHFYSNLRHVAYPHLQYLVDTIEETSSLSTLLNSAVINLDQVEFSGRLVVRAGNMSNRMPFYATSSGKAIAAYLPEAELKSLMESTFISLTGGTITDKEVFKRELKQVRAQGYATAFEELEEGLNSVAAPVFNHAPRSLQVSVSPGQIIALTINV